MTWRKAQGIGIDVLAISTMAREKPNRRGAYNGALLRFAEHQSAPLNAGVLNLAGHPLASLHTRGVELGALPETLLRAVKLCGADPHAHFAIASAGLSTRRRRNGKHRPGAQGNGQKSNSPHDSLLGNASLSRHSCVTISDCAHNTIVSTMSQF